MDAQRYNRSWFLWMHIWSHGEILWTHPLLVACQDATDETGFSYSTDDCPVWASISPESSIRSFASTEDYERGTGVTTEFVSQVESMTVSDSGRDVRLVVDGISESDSWDSHSYQTISHYRCDAIGAWLLSSQTEMETVIDGMSVSQITETIYFDAFIMPPIIELGDSWQSVFTGETTDSAGTISEHRTVIDSTVTAVENLTVGAGQFDALVIEERFEDDRRSAYRVAAGPGFLLSDDYELMDYSEP